MVAKRIEEMQNRGSKNGRKKDLRNVEQRIEEWQKKGFKKCRIEGWRMVEKEN